MPAPGGSRSFTPATLWILQATDGIVACVGNHEYWLDADKKEVESYKAATIQNLKDEWKGVPASTVQLGGANFFVFDDSFGTVTETIAAAFEETVKEGLPIVMVCHVPLWTEDVGLNRGASCGVKGRAENSMTGRIERFSSLLLLFPPMPLSQLFPYIFPAAKTIPLPPRSVTLAQRTPVRFPHS